MKYVALPLAALSLCGCTASGPLYQDAPTPPEGKALVYIYREATKTFSWRQAWFSVDNVEVGELYNQGYMWAYVPAGVHILKQEWPRDITHGRPTDINIVLQAGRTYYFKLRTASSIYPSGRGVMMEERWEILDMAPRLGSSEIAQYHYEPAEHPDVAAAADKISSAQH